MADLHSAGEKSVHLNPNLDGSGGESVEIATLLGLAV